MSEFLILGSGSNLLNPDGAVAWDKGAESGNFATLVTKAFSPQGLEGDAVFRRAYLTVEHKSGISLALTPILDGVRLEECVAYLSRPAPPSAKASERYTFVIPLFSSLQGRRGNVGARGTTIQLEVAGYSPNGDWWIENPGFMIALGSRAKKED